MIICELPIDLTPVVHDHFIERRWILSRLRTRYNLGLTWFFYCLKF